MLTTPELILEAGQLNRLEELMPRWFEVPLYRSRLKTQALTARHVDSIPTFSAWPLISKDDIRDGFPSNLLSDGTSIQKLLAEGMMELEHTSGTTAGDLRALKLRLESLLDSPAGLEIQSTDLLMPETSGKFRLTVPR